VKKIFFIFCLLINAISIAFEPISLDPIAREWDMISHVLTKLVKQYEENTEYMRSCPCIDIKTRISFAREIIRELMIRHPRNQEMQYASFASGALLQDYIIIIGLVMMGYEKLNISFIDLVYEKDVTRKVIKQFIEQLNQDIHKSNTPIAPIINIRTYTNARSYFNQNPPKPDIILFADPDMNAFTSYNPDISRSGIIDFPNLKTKAIFRNNEKPIWFALENADADMKHNALNLCKISTSNNSQESMQDFATKNNIYHFVTNHQFVSFDEFIRNPYFNNTNPLIALLHHPFATALTTQATSAPAYLITRQDYLQYDYTLQALPFTGFKQFTCKAD
jgi:hypothetical protein